MTALAPHPYDVEVGQLLRQVRHAYRVKQQELAERLNLDTATISRYERGERGMNVSLLLTIADLFRIPGSRLLPVRHQEAPTTLGSTPAALAGVPIPPTSASSSLSELETRAITTLANVLAAHPELIVGVMDYVEHQDLVVNASVSGSADPDE
jgi:transcriptional regulator with XRE-family HTH domain